MLLALAGCPSTLLAAEAAGFQLNGRIQLRQQFLDGQIRPGLASEDEILGVRTNLTASWQRGAWRLLGELQDGRSYHSPTGGLLTVSDVNVFEPLQAYVQRDFNVPFGAGSHGVVQAGRFRLNVGSRRLVSSLDTSNTTQGYTGVRAELNTRNTTRITGFYTLPQQRLPDDVPALRDNQHALDREGRDLQLFGAMIMQPQLLAGASGEMSYIVLHEKDRAANATRNRHLHNISARLFRDPARAAADFDVEAIYQRGHQRSSSASTAPRIDVNAYFFHLEAGYTWALTGQPRLSLDFDHASGDGRGPDNQRFDTLFGIRRSELGPSGLYSAIGRTNLQAFGPRLEITPSPRFDALVTWKILRAADRQDSFSTTGVRDASGNSGRRAGQQFDGRLRVWLVPATLQLELNATWLRRGRLLREAPNAPATGNTRYFSAAAAYSF